MQLKLNPRSLLNTPALNIRGHNKAGEIGVDVGIIDLEDSIPKNKKEEARKAAKNFLNVARSFITALRINSIRSPEGLQDILFFIEINNVPDIVILPKVESEEEIIILRELLSVENNLPALFSVIESPKGLVNINQIARASSGLIFGSADYAAELGIDITSEGMLFVRSTIALTAARFKIPAIDAPYFNVNNEQGLIDECINVKKIGFHGKIAIHPSQVKAINQIFTPDANQLAYAKNILDEFTQSKKIISTLDGIMIGPPFIKLAKKILSQSRDSNIHV